MRVQQVNLLLSEIEDPEANVEDFFEFKRLQEEREQLLRQFEALEQAIFQREHRRVLRLLR